MFRSGSRLARLGLILLLLLATVPVSQTIDVAAQAGELEITILDTGFDPAQATVPVGTSVRWTNEGTEPHTLVSLDGDFDPVPFEPGQDFSVTLTVAGTYSFQLDDDPDTFGSIEVTGGAVRDLDQTAPSAVPSPVPPTTATTTTTTAPPVASPAATESVELPDVPQTVAGPALNLTPVETPRLAHIHAGNCEELGIVVYSFAGAQSYRIEPAADNRGPTELLVGSAGVPLLNLFNEPFSIHVHESAENKQNYVACADIGGQPAAPWAEADGLVLELVEQAGSGMAGFASLRQGPNGTTDVSLFLSGQTGPVEAPATTTTPPSTYTSLTFGYSISYNDTWDVSEETSSGGRDTLILTNDTSFVAFTGARAFSGDPADCVSGLLQERTADPNAFNIEVALDENGEPQVGGTDATGAFAVFNHDYRFATGVVPYTLFVACVPLIPGEAILGVVQNSPAADYESQVAPREGLLRGLVLDQ